jgi:hypothetical protein
MDTSSNTPSALARTRMKLFSAIVANEADVSVAPVLLTDDSLSETSAPVASKTVHDTAELEL